MGFTPLPNMSDEDAFAPAVPPSLVPSFRFEPQTTVLQYRIGEFQTAEAGWLNVGNMPTFRDFVVHVGDTPPNDTSLIWFDTSA